MKLENLSMRADTLLRTCTVYAHKRSDTHLLYVCETAGFPSKTYPTEDWRPVALCVEPPEEARRSLRVFSFYDTHIGGSR